jgi:hypothetical protein
VCFEVAQSLGQQVGGNPGQTFLELTPSTDSASAA